MHSSSAPSGTPRARPAAINATPPTATAAPASCARPGRSPRNTTASAIVNTVWVGRTTDARPAGIPLWIATNRSPNWPALMNVPTPITHRSGTGGRRTRNTAGNATSVKRSAANSSGGNESSPTSMTTKLIPQTVATATASRT